MFLNYDGKELYKTMVKAGETAIYDGDRKSVVQGKFIGWNKPLKNITDNLIVTAVFEKPKKGSLKLGAMSFIENEKTVHVIEQAVISNEDLYRNKEKDMEREQFFKA